MGKHRVDISSLVAGCVTVVLGVLLLLDQFGALNLTLAYLAAAAAAVVGAILLARGWTRGARG